MSRSSLNFAPPTQQAHTIDVTHFLFSPTPSADLDLLSITDKRIRFVDVFTLSLLLFLLFRCVGAMDVFFFLRPVIVPVLSVFAVFCSSTFLSSESLLLAEAIFFL